MSCSSCNRKNRKNSTKSYSIDKTFDFLKTIDYSIENNKTDEEYMSDIYDMYDNMDQISLNIDDLSYNLPSYNLPREIVNNKNIIPGTEVNRYLNFTNLKNACDLCNNIVEQDRTKMNTPGFIDKGSQCNYLMNTPEEGENCFDLETIKLSDTYWINGIREKIINPEYLIPNIFRLCQFNDFSCPSSLRESLYKSITGDIKTIFKLQNLNYNRPKLVEPYVMQSLLYTGVITNSSNVSDNKYSTDSSNNFFMNTNDLCDIMKLLNFNYCKSLNWTIMNIMRYYNNSLLFQLIDFIGICFKANEYYNIGKKICNYRVPWTSTVICITDIDNNCTRNVYYSEIPLSFEQLKIIYSTTIQSQDILYYINNNIDYGNNSNNRLSVVFYYALKVFQDVLLEMKYSMSPYNSIQQSKYFCKKKYMLYNPSAHGSDEENRIYEQICSYVCAMKYKCIAYNPRYYKHMCVELYQMSNYTDNEHQFGPSLHDIVFEKGLEEYFSNKQYYKGGVDSFIDVSILSPLAVYDIDDCGIGPLRINNDYNINVSILPLYRNKYRLLYLLWDKDGDCKDCLKSGCSNNNIKSLTLEPSVNCNCLITKGNDPNQYPTNAALFNLSFNIDKLTDNYCLRIFYYKLVENLYIENDKANKGDSLFDISMWRNYYDYNYTTINNIDDYYNTFNNTFSSVDSVDLTGIFCSFLNTFELPINKPIDSFNLKSTNTISKNIMGFGIYSYYNNAKSDNILYYSQFFLKKDQEKGIYSDKGSILGCNFSNSNDIIAAGALTNIKSCKSFYDSYYNEKIYYINVLSYKPTYTFTNFSEANSLIIDNGTNIKSLITKNEIDNKNDTTSSSLFKTQINPDIYMSTTYFNPNDWFFITPKGNINNKTSDNIQYDFDYLWFPPLDLMLNNTKSIEKGLPSTFKAAQKEITTKSNYIYYEKGDNNDVLNSLIAKGVNKYFTIDERINIKTYQFTVKRTKSESMSYLLQEGSLNKVKYSPFYLDINKIDDDPSKNFNYSFKSNETLKSRTLNNSTSINNGLYFNIPNECIGIYNNENSILVDKELKSFIVNDTLYYKSDNINLDRNQTVTCPQPFSSTVLPYKYQIDYIQNIGNTDTISNSNISCIKANYNYILPIYSPIKSNNIKVNYYPVNGELPEINNSIDIFELAPTYSSTSIYDSNNNQYKAFPNMNILYTIKTGDTVLNNIIKNKFYSWGQYSVSFDDNIYKGSENPHFRYINTIDGKISYNCKDNFINFRNKGYYLECIDQIKSSDLKDIKLDNYYDNGKYISIIPGFDDENSITNSQLIMYPIIKIKGLLSNYYSENNYLEISKGHLKSDKYTIYYKSNALSNNYRRYLEIDDIGDSKGMKYINLNNVNSFGIYYYDNLKSNYYPYEKGNFSVKVKGNIIFSKGNKGDKDTPIKFPIKAYKSDKEDNNIFEPIISKGVDNYYFNEYYKIYNKGVSELQNNNSIYNFIEFEKANNTKAISEPAEFNLHYNYISFIEIASGSTLGNSGDIKSLTINQHMNNNTDSSNSITIKSDDIYYGIIPNANYTLKSESNLVGYTKLRYTMYKADGYDWSIVKSYTALSATFENIEYDNYISVKLLGEPIDIFTNFNNSQYPLIFDRLKSSKSVNFLETYNIEPSYSDKAVNTIWPKYIANGITDICNLGDRTDISSSFVLKIGASNELNNYKSNDCFKAPTEIVKADTIGMSYISYENPLKGIKANKYGLYDRTYCNVNTCKSDILYFAPVTAKGKSTMVMQFDTKQSDLYQEHLNIKIKGYNTLGGVMSMSNNIMIAGTPIYQRTQYYNNDLYKYSSKGAIYFFDINENITNNNIDDITLLKINNRYIISCSSHYSIYNTDIQNILLFSINSSIDLPNTNPVKGNYKGSIIYQFVEDSGLIFPYMSPSDIGNNLINDSNYLNGYSMDFIESNTQLYSLSSIIGNIPDLTNTVSNTNQKGSIFFLNNYFDHKNSISKINTLTDNIYLDDLITPSPNIIFDQFGYKVKTLYVDINNNAYIMIINRVANIDNNYISHAFLTKIDINNLQSNKITSDNIVVEDYIELKGYQIIDASGTVCDGLKVNNNFYNQRIVFYLSLLEIENTSDFIKGYSLNTDIFNNTTKNVDKVIEVVFNNNGTKYEYQKGNNKLFFGFPALSDDEKPYIKKNNLASINNIDFVRQEEPCYIFGKTLDVANANLRIPYKGSTELYRTNFLLSNKKYNNKGNIFSTATLYADRIIEELSHKADYFKDNNYNQFYSDIYVKSLESISNIELFTYPFQDKGEYYTTPLKNNGNNNYDYCSNVIFSDDIDNIETTNDCYLELPKYMAISNIYVKSIKSNDENINDNNEINILIYKNKFSYY